MLFVTIREGEERGICCAALKELLKIVKDQIEERSVAVIVSSKESARDWSQAADAQQNKIKSDTVENVATGGMKIGELESWQKTDFGEHRDGWIQHWKSWKSQTDEGRKDQDEENLCKSIIKGFARRNRQTHAILARDWRRNSTSHALMTSPAKNCRGMKNTKLVNKN